MDNALLIMASFVPSVLRFRRFFEINFVSNCCIDRGLVEKVPKPKKPRKSGWRQRFYQERQDHVTSQDKARELLEQSDAYNITKKSRRRFRRNQIVVTNLCQQFQVDLADLQKFRKENKHFRYLLVVIDCFSQKVAVAPLINKTGDRLVLAFEKIFKNLGELEKIQSDKRSEFFNSRVQSLFKRFHITHFSSENEDIKCSMVERFIRTLKSHIWRLFRSQNSTQYHDKLQDIAKSYNNSVSTAHQMVPNDVTQQTLLAVFGQLYGEKRRKRTPKYAAGNHVRIAINKDKLEKGYEYRSTGEVFVIVKDIRHAVPVYRIEDLKGELIKGKFYESEFSLVHSFKPRKLSKLKK